MREDVSHQLANCLKTQQGSYVFYRGYGLSVVDATNPPIRRDILVQLSTYYPEITLSDVTISKVESNGSFEYIVETRG